jgi:hypothetical protein
VATETATAKVATEATATKTTTAATATTASGHDVGRNGGGSKRDGRGEHDSGPAQLEQHDTSPS